MINKKTTSQDKRNNLIYIAITLHMIDYIITWIGIKIYSIIEEANPFMKILFIDNIPFILSILLRIIFISIIVVMLIYLKNKDNSSFSFIVKFDIIVNIILLLYHINIIMFTVSIGAIDIVNYIEILSIYSIPLITSIFITYNLSCCIYNIILHAITILKIK